MPNISASVQFRTYNEHSPKIIDYLNTHVKNIPMNLSVYIHKAVPAFSLWPLRFWPFMSQKQYSEMTEMLSHVATLHSILSTCLQLSREKDELSPRNIQIIFNNLYESFEIALLKFQSQCSAFLKPFDVESLDLELGKVYHLFLQVETYVFNSIGLSPAERDNHFTFTREALRSESVVLRPQEDRESRPFQRGSSVLPTRQKPNESIQKPNESISLPETTRQAQESHSLMKSNITVPLKNKKNQTRPLKSKSSGRVVPL